MGNGNVIGEKIRHYRKLNELTQKKLAEELGVAPKYIANIEQGKKGISLERLVELCRHFNIGLSDILPLGEEDGTKARWIGEITEHLGRWDTAQVGLLRAMIRSQNE